MASAFARKAVTEEPEDTGPPKISRGGRRRGGDEGPLSRMRQQKAEPAKADEEAASSVFADDQSEQREESEVFTGLLETPADNAAAEVAMNVTSPAVAAFPLQGPPPQKSSIFSPKRGVGSAASTAVSSTPFDTPDIFGTLEAAAEKGSPKAISKMERELKDTLGALNQLRSDHRSLRDEAERLRQGLVAGCSENKALRRCLEMRGVIGAKEFEAQYAPAYRETRGDFTKAVSRGGFGREDMKSSAGGRPECRNLGLGSPVGSMSPTISFGTSSPGGSRMGKTKSTQKKPKENDFFDFYGVEEQIEEEEEPPPRKEKQKPTNWTLVGKWLKIMISYKKKHRQDKIKMRPEGDLYMLMANILFPRCTSHDQRVQYLNELKMSLQRRELICDHWDGPQTPLRYSVERHHVELVKALLRGKANADESDHKGISLLHFAVFDNRLELCEQLLTWKGNPNIADKLGNTPLFFAPDISICHALWDARANAELLNKRGQSALHLVAQAGNGEVLLWLSAHVSRSVLHHHDCNGAGALYYARQSHIPPTTIRKIVECKQSNELIKRMADIREKAHLPSALTGHLYMEDFNIDEEIGIFGQIDFDDPGPDEPQETVKKDYGLGGFGGFGSGFDPYDMDDDPKKKKKQKKKQGTEGHPCIKATMLALQDLDSRFKVEEETRLARRNMVVQARDFAARMAREQAILHASKKRAKETETNGDDGQEAEDLQEQKTLTPRSARVQMIDLTRLAAAQKSRDYARQLRLKREQEKKSTTRDDSPTYRMTDIHENLNNIPDGSQWRACTVRNMQMELFDVANNAKPAIEQAAPAYTGTEAPSVILSKKRFSTSRVHQPVPFQDLYQAHRWKAEQQKLDERMARRMIDDSEAASRIQSAFRRFSLSAADKSNAEKVVQQSAEPIQASSDNTNAKKKKKEKDKVQKLTYERRESQQQEEILARDLQIALERLQTESDAMPIGQNSSAKQEEGGETKGKDKDGQDKPRKSRKTIRDDSGRERKSMRERDDDSRDNTASAASLLSKDGADAKKDKKDKERRKSHRHRDGDEKIKKEKSHKHHSRKTKKDEEFAAQILKVDPQDDAVAAALALQAIGNYTEEHIKKATMIQSFYRAQKAKNWIILAREQMAEELAATRVQATFRGKKERKLLKQGKFPGRPDPEAPAPAPPPVESPQPKASPKKGDDPDDDDLDEDGLDNMMEEAIRTEQEEAATKIQSIRRGKVARREAQAKMAAKANR